MQPSGHSQGVRMLGIVHHHSIQRHDRKHSAIGQVAHGRLGDSAVCTFLLALESEQSRVAPDSYGRLVQAWKAYSRPVVDTQGKMIILERHRQSTQLHCMWDTSEGKGHRDTSLT